MNVIETTGMTREEVFEMRRGFIGASDLVKICGLQPSRFGVYLDKTEGMKFKPSPEQAEQMRWGLRLEDDIVDELAEQGTRIVRQQVMVRDERFPWLTALVDGFEADEEGWELKATGIARGAKLEAGNVATLLEDWIIQTHQQMFVCGKDHWNLAAFIGHRLRLATWRIEFDPDLWAPCLELAREFRDHIERREPPTEFDAADVEPLRQYFNRVEPTWLESDDDFDVEHARLFVGAKVAQKAAKQLELANKAALLARIGNHEAARIGPYEFKRSLRNRKASVRTVKASSYVDFRCTNQAELNGDGDDE